MYYFKILGRIFRLLQLNNVNLYIYINIARIFILHN